MLTALVRTLVGKMAARIRFGERRRFTANCASWASQWLLRDRGAIYGDVFRRRVAGMGIGEVISSPSSPWQNPYAERLIGSIRRECLDHVIVLGDGICSEC